MKQITQEFNAITTTRLAIRLATLEDIPEITTIMELSTRELNNEDYNPPQVDTLLDYFIGIDEQLIKDETYYVATADDMIIACGGWSRYEAMFNNTHPQQETDYHFMLPKSGSAKIRLMYVHPDFKRLGMASAILQRSITDAIFDGYQCLELTTTVTAVSFYERFGFEIVKPQIFTLSNDVIVHGLHMALSLS